FVTRPDGVNPSLVAPNGSHVQDRAVVGVLGPLHLDVFLPQLLAQLGRLLRRAIRLGPRNAIAGINILVGGGLGRRGRSRRGGGGAPPPGPAGAAPGAAAAAVGGAAGVRLAVVVPGATVP